MDTKSIKIYDHDDIGEVQITNEVIAVIAGLAATEVEGVDSLANNITKEIVARLGGKKLSAGVEVHCEEQLVDVTVQIVVNMGCNIPEVSRNVQDKVKNAIESMTGLEVAAVNVVVANMKVTE